MARELGRPVSVDEVVPHATAALAEVFDLAFEELPAEAGISRRVSTARLETFADGVFAIAATLLILNVDAQVVREAPDLGTGCCTSGRRTSPTRPAS